MADNSFLICACTLTSEVHVIRDDKVCEMCDGPTVATPKLIELAFREYQRRVEQLMQSVAVSEAEVKRLVGLLGKEQARRGAD